ncbi:MAG: SRPBCC family protein [Planctomycetes bacterium]|nr:SRPBCC family protein [Planctomycetota bacterium]
MKWLKIGCGIVGALLSFLLVSGSIAAKCHVATVKATFAKPAADVWQRVTDHATQPKWRKDLKSLVMLPPAEGKTCFEEEGEFGKVRFVVDELVAPTRYVVRIASTYAATTLSITEEGEVTRFLFRALSPFFSKTATIETYLVALGGDLEVDVKTEVVVEAGRDGGG